MKTLMLLFILIFCGIGGFFTATIPFSQELAWISALSVLFIAFPAFFVTLQTLGLKRGLLVLFLLSIFGLTIESIGVLTGFPYGSFYYAEKIGVKIFDVVPWTVPFAWVPLVIGSFTLAQKITHGMKVVILSTIFLVAIDLVLDPGAFALGFWIWKEPGWYYGIPLQNYVGWILSGSIGSFLLYTISRHINFPSTAVISMLFTTVFWTAVCFTRGLTIPAIIGVFILIGITYLSRTKPLYD